jgi:hypothetical protein
MASTGQRQRSWPSAQRQTGTPWDPALRQLESLTVPSLDRLRLTRSMTFDDHDYTVASTQSKPAVDLEVNFERRYFAVCPTTKPAAAQSTPSAKAATDADKKAISKPCSDQATANSLHGKTGKAFRYECKKNGRKAA